MIRRPLLRAAQAALASAAAALAAVSAVRVPPAGIHFSVAALGEREQADGSWEGVDLIREPGAAIDRVQLNVNSETDARALVEARAADGSWQRLYLGTLAGHRDYALPAPHLFFGVQGNAEVRLTLWRVHANAADPVAARPGEAAATLSLPLSDGTPFPAGRTQFEAPRAATLSLQLHGR